MSVQLVSPSSLISHIPLSFHHRRLHHLHYSLIFYCHTVHRHPHSFPTRRSSDLHRRTRMPRRRTLAAACTGKRRVVVRPLDRKSTRLNSSHVAISYAVFCLKKKTSMSLTSYDFTRSPTMA